MQDRPLLGHVLAGRQARRVEARRRAPCAPALDRNIAAYTSPMASVATKAYIRPRAYVRVEGPDAADLLQRIVSNDVLAAGRVRGADPDARRAA